MTYYLPNCFILGLIVLSYLKVSITEPVKPDLDHLTALQARVRMLQNELDAATKYARAQEAEKRSIVLRKGVEI